MKRTLLTLAFLQLIFNHSFAQCVQACGVYTLSGISYSTFPNTGTFVTLGDDDTSTFVPIGFSFNFYCNTYTKVKICSNGFITFDNSVFTTSSTPYAQFLPSATLPNAVIAFNWNDLDPSSGGTISYNTVGTSPNQQFIVTYSNVPLWSYGGSNTGQIVLYESDASIEIHNALCINNGFLTHTEGIENANASVGSAVPGRNLALWTATNSAHRWQKIYVGTQPTGLTGNTMVCAGDPVTYTINNMPGASSYSWTYPNSWNGTTISTILNGNAMASGNVLVTATYSCGTSPPAAIAVTVNPIPYISVNSVSPQVLCSGGSVTITPGGGASYTMDPGGTTGLPPFVIVPAAGTTYSITGSSAYGCVNSTPVVVPLTVNQTPTVTVNSGSICIGQTFAITPGGATSYTYSTPFTIVSPTVSGTYTFQVSGFTSGCSAQAISTLVVYSLPSTSITASRPSICAGESLSLTAQGASTYTWSYNNSTAPVQTVTPVQTTTYTVKGRDAIGCTKDGTLSIVVNACTGIEKVRAGLELIQVYPNPSNGEFNLVASSPVSIIVYDKNGREVIRKDVEGGQQRLNLESLVAGQYLLRAEWQGRQQRIVLIKE